MSLSVRIFRTDTSSLLLVLPAALLLVSFGLGARDLWAPDEPRAGEVAREILRSGSWAVLHDNGTIYLEKPPLFFWLVAAASQPDGRVTGFSARLPSSLAALAALIVLFYLGRDLFGRRTGALAVLTLATMQGFFMEARWAHPDMLWAFFLGFACLAFHRAIVTEGARLWLAGFYLSLGLACLTKGPAGLLLPLGAVVLFLGVTGRSGFLRRAGLAWGLPLALLPTGLWLLAYRLSSGGLFPVGPAMGRLLERFTHGLHHTGSPWHFVSALAIETLPWTVMLPLAIGQTFPRRRHRPDTETAYLYSWLLVYVGVFALSAEKRGVYLLPILPLLAILVARMWDTALLGWDPSPLERPVRIALLVTLALTIGVAVVVMPRIREEGADLERPAALLAMSLVLVTGAALLTALRYGSGAALGVLAGGMVAPYLLVAGMVLPALNHYKSARGFCERVAAATAASPLGIYPDYHASYAFYSGRFLSVLRTRDDLSDFVSGAPRVYCLMEARQYEIERRLLATTLRVIDRERVGHRSMLLVAVGSPAAANGHEGETP